MPICEICQKKTFLIYHIANYKYYKCYNCYNLFLFPKPTHKQLDKFYKSSFIYRVTPFQEQRLRSRSEIILKKLKNLNSSGKSLLDIGSGYGFFLEQAKKYQFKTLGLEPSKDLYQSLLKRKLNILNLQFEDFHTKNKFDFITMIHTIEHVYQPEKVIKKALQLLNKNGILFIETPNLSSHLYNFEKINYTFLTPPEHIWIFSQISFQKILKKLSAKIISISTYSYPEHLMGIIKIILKSSPRSPLFPSSPISSPSRQPFSKSLKYLIFDQILARLTYRILNINGYGSFLELYIKKKS